MVLTKGDAMKVLLRLVFGWAILGVAAITWGQLPDSVLFTVNGRPVTVGEFRYIYEKNYGDRADYHPDSIAEYLDLYIKFKLKVEEALQQRMDTLPHLVAELNKYRKQLAKSFLMDKAVFDTLVEELYNRMQWDVDVSHILIAVPQDSKDTARAFAKAKQIRSMLEEGASFAQLAKKFSDDKNTARKGGRVGWVTAKLPDGFYGVETAIYETPVGEIAGPVRSRVGYHILRINGRRPARGMIHAAHILVRKAKRGKPDSRAKAKIDSIYALLEAGASFEELAKKYSDDRTSRHRGGDIGWFGINKFEEPFEEAAFSLERDGAYSKPVETSIGWHIIKRLEKKDIGPLDRLMRLRLEREIREDSRFEIAKRALINKIKRDNHFILHKNAIAHLRSHLDSTLFSYRWTPPELSEDEVLMQIGDSVYTVQDFLEYLQQNTSLRLGYDMDADIGEALSEMVDAFVNEKVMEYEEAQLEKKYPAFRNLMREYREGILLFEIAKEKIWDKAAQDTAGLRAFFKKHRQRYMHPVRAEVTEVEIQDIDAKTAQKLYKRALKRGVEKALHKYRKRYKGVEKTSSLYDEEQFKRKYKGLEFKKGSATPLEYDANRRIARFAMVTKLVPPTPRELDEARGYVLSDYQNYLEEQWVKELRAKYPVEVNRKALERLIQQGRSR